MDNNSLTQVYHRYPVRTGWLRHGLLTPLLVAMCCLFGTPHAALANSAFESPARLMLTAKQYIHAAYAHKFEISVDFGYLDRRLHLARCQQPLEAFFPVGQNAPIATSVGIRCGEPNWQVYIPVNIHAYTMVLTASRPLARDTILAAPDLKLRKREISQYRSGVFEDKRQLIGMVLKRPLAEGSVFTPREVTPRRLVRRGEPVIIMAESHGMTVRVQGQALMDGQHGQMIQVRNTRSGRKLVAEVVGTSIVRVKM